jgi:hypothetical protein
MFIKSIPLGLMRKYGAKRFMKFGAVVHKDNHDDHGDHGDHGHHHVQPSRPTEEYNTVSKFLDHATL